MNQTIYNFLQFFEYFNEFYGVGGLYPIEGLTVEDVIYGVKTRIERNPEIDFEGDSLDREAVRDIVLERKTGVRQNNMFLN